jgi:hypothetical protein
MISTKVKALERRREQEGMWRPGVIKQFNERGGYGENPDVQAIRLKQVARRGAFKRFCRTRCEAGVNRAS